jgi:hypothetical protein
MELTFLKKNQKAQSSIEFLVLIVILLVFVQTIIQPSLEETTLAVKDTQRVGQATLAADKLVNAIEQISAITGESKTTVNLFLPEDVQIKCQAAQKRITYQLNLEHPTEVDHANCTNNSCTKIYDLALRNTTLVDCTEALIDSGAQTHVRVVIEKDVGGTVHVQAQN